MQQFDILEIQKNIEEKRLILGQKIESFLLKNLRIFWQKIDHFIASKNFCLWSVLTIFLFSIYLRSSLDIGEDSAAYIDLAGKMFRGGKYYYDFFESNFPLSFWIQVIPYAIADFLKINPIITTEIFINFLGILSLLLSAQILKKSNLKQVHKNLLITLFAVGFFLRIYASMFNEFLTKTSFLLCFAYPYIAFSFSRKEPLNKKEKFCRGLLAGLIPCLKPHYILLPLLIEANRFWQKKSLKFFFEIDKIVMCLVGLSYLFLMLKFMPEYFEFMLPMWRSYYPAYNFSDLFLLNVMAHLSARILFFGGIFLIFLREKFSDEDKILLLVFIAASIILILENTATIDQMACFFALIIPVFGKKFYDFLKSEKIKFGIVGLSCTFFVILSFTVPDSLYTIARMSIFWWIIIPIMTIGLYKKLNAESVKFTAVFGSKFNKTKINIIGVLTFILLVVGSFFIASKNQPAYMLISVLMMLSFIFFYEKIYAKFYKNLSPFFIFTQFLIAAALIALVNSSISYVFNGKEYSKFPSSLTDEMMQYSKIYAEKKEDKIFIWSNLISFSITEYIGKKEPYIYHGTDPLYAFDWKESDKLVTDKANLSFMINYFFNDLKLRIKDKNLQLIFINNTPMSMRREGRCMINFLENYFQDREFRETFLRNYKFVGRIFLTKTLPENKEVKFFAEKKEEAIEPDLPRVETIYDFEVYARKDK